MPAGRLPSGSELVSAAPLAIEPFRELDLRDSPRRVQVDPFAPRAANATPAAHKRQILEERRFDRQDVKSRHVLGAVDPFEHEHVTPFLWRRKERFGFRQLGTAQPFGHYRLCVDEAADLALVTALVERLAPARPDFGWRDCIGLLDAEPALAALNAEVQQRHVK